MPTILKFARNHQLVSVLWLLVAYLLVLYAALRWGAGGRPLPRK